MNKIVYIVNITKKNKIKIEKYKNMFIESISITLLTSKIPFKCRGHSKLFRYIFNKKSNIRRSLNMKPVYIINFLSHISTVFFCKKSSKKPSNHINSFLV